ncbi:MAG: flippase-like domain-containing protein [Fibrobacterales bacterium]
MSKWTIIKACVAAVLLTVVGNSLYHSLQGERLVDALLGIEFHVGWFAVSVGVTIVSLVLGCVQWRMLLSYQGVSIPFKKVFALFFVGLFFNNFMPGNVGGDVKKIYDMKKYTEHYSSSFTATFFDRLIGLFAISLISLVAGLVFFYGDSDVGFLILPAVWVCGGIILFMIALFSRRVGLILDKVLRRVSLEKVADMVAKIQSCFHLYRRGTVWARLLPLSITIQLLRVSSKYFIALSLGVMFPVSTFLFLVPFIDIVTAIPISIGGHGVREIAATKVYGAVGIAELHGILIQELAYIALAVISVLGAYFFVMHKRERSDEKHT